MLSHRPFRHSLTSRLLLMITGAAILPLLALTVAILVESYQAIRTATYATIEQTCRRIASDFEARFDTKLGLIRGAALSMDRGITPGSLVTLLAHDQDFSEVWVRMVGEADPQEPLYRKALFEEVKIRGSEILSAPQFDRYQASLGVPLFHQNQLVGMVGVSFSLGYFKEVTSSVHLLKTGYAFMVSHEGLRIAHPDKTLIGKKIGADVTPALARLMLDKVAQGNDFWVEKRALLNDKWSRQFYSAIRVGQAPSPWFFAVVAPEEEAVYDVNLLFRLLILGVLATLVLVAGAAWWSTRSVVRPLRALAEGAEAVASGRRDARVLWASSDEIGTLAGAFNRMADQLVQALENQENLVRLRTASLQQSLTDLEMAQEKLVENEKMAVLGQLTARIAHDLNTPLGAIRSSGNLLKGGLASQTQDLPGFFQGLSLEEVEWFKALVVGRGSGLITATGDRTRRRDLAQRLAAAGLDDPESLAEDIVLLVSSEADGGMVNSAAGGRAEIIRKAAQAAILLQSAAIVVEAADRAASTVRALVDYSRVQDVGQSQEYDPAHEIDMILTLYYGDIRRHVEVTRDFEPGLMLRGDRDKLNQVWANLIRNALQAMDFRGRLVLSTRTGPLGAEVSVANDGPPVPPELRERIFEAFFTTKKPGEGTGLGLDICRRIIRAHGGTLTLSQSREMTVFTAQFPLASQAPDEPKAR